MAATDPRRRIPQVDRLTREVAEEFPDLPQAVAADAARTVVAAVRRRARRTQTVPSADEIRAAVRDEAGRRRAALLRPVLNATGVVLHTNLGRAPLAPAAVEAVVRVAGGYSNLEWDTTTGRRGDRYVHVEPLIALATGAQAALVVNNNAAAVLLVCAALATGREVVISRGELIEIGGEFRIPEVLSQSGAILREVGTTNRTHLRDYERAVDEGTGLVLKVHPSNYRVVGFTASPSMAEIAEVARRAKVPSVYDVGSGLLHRAMADEPVVSDALSQGADLVCFSGDKLFGGPQAGIVCGRRRLVDRLRTHPLLRALRPDKMQLAALGATVGLYLESRVDGLPVWQMVDADPDALRRRCATLGRRLRASGYETEVVASASVAGGGSLPGHDIPTPALRVTHPGYRATALSAALREGDPPVIVRIEDQAVICDLRTVPPERDRDLPAAFAAAAGA